MRITTANQFQPFRAALSDLKIDLDGVTNPLGEWVRQFNEIRRSFNGADFQPYGLNEVTRDDLATEFAFEAYSAWDGAGETHV